MQQAQQQSVPSLLDLLHLASGSGSMVLFDLHRPPPAHPHRDTWIQRILDVVLNQSAIPPSQVLWLPSDLRDQVQELEPDLQQTSGSQRPLEDLQRNNIVRLNLHYSHVSASMVRQYALLNISVNLYVVSEPWLFSVAWCSGVQSVTSNCPHTLRDMRRPLLLMSPVQYQTLWTLSDLVSLLLVLLLFCFHWWRERSLSLISAHRALDTGTYISTELCEVWSVSSANAEDSL
ncbi:unnamed protein product [Knipowitschia caucasica]|uniref:GP-PDE domain-containing protein n=1 Tax=Knipowitschia caucasica TaxID=637954 RepID=A0AAV2JCI3_KNICA